MAPSNPSQLKKDSKIIIVGAGVFGLSTTLHLLKRGYTNIHIFDRQPFSLNNYEESLGAHGASCDINKIVRASYGGKQLYQDLAFKAMPEWERWNAELAATPQSDLPSTLSPEVPLWHNCGFLRLSPNGLDKEEIETQKHFPPEIKHTQYRFSDPQRRKEALKAGIPATKLDPFNHIPRQLPTDGILDMTAGFVLASRACTWALHLCMKSPYVTTHFGESNALLSLLKSTSKNRVTGIKTADKVSHSADLVLIACGGWTPSLLPQSETILETTSGSVLSIQLPANRPDLWDKYSSKNFPVWSWNMSGYKPNSTIGGLYGMPATPEGIIKVAFRGAKWTSYTRHTSEHEPLSYPYPDIHKIPSEAMRVLRTFCLENMPDLLDLDLSNIRLCWYTDSIDNDFLISPVPGLQNLIVASGGSGHGFKFLPVLGEHVVDVVEKKNTPYTKLFAWRDVPTEGKRNGLEEGPGGWRNLEKQRLAGNEEWRAGGRVGAKL